jgi:CelD/BcsL family acetyltransferase involved in cellulose biosynthesis
VIELEMQDPRWDSFVLSAQGATAFHLSGWLAALAHENGQRPVKLACEGPDGTLTGVLPLMATRGIPLGVGGAATGRRLVSLPRTPIAGPLGTGDAVVRALTEAAIARARSAGYLLQLKPGTRTLDGLVPGLEGGSSGLSYVKPLPADPDQLRFGKSRNHARIVWSVRKAQREGLRLRYATSETDLRDWYRLYLDVHRWRAVVSRPYRMFQAAWEQLSPGGTLRLLLVHRRQPGRDLLVGGSMLLMLGDTAFYAFNGVSREALPLRPNDFLMWQAMRDAAAEGYRWYDFGEGGNAGLAQFKEKWDTETQARLRYYAPPLDRDATGPAAPGTMAWPRRVAREAWRGAWRRVPLPVTAAAGGQVYRFL